jgi:predicted lipid-binding transport protein (Tim44 family)
MRLSGTAANPLAIGLIVVSLAGCGGEDEADRSPGSTAAAPPDPPADVRPAPKPGEPADAPGGEQKSGGGGRPSPSPAASATEPRDDAVAKDAELEAAVGAYEDYIAAINARDGERLCELLPPDALGELRPAVTSGGCAHRIGASIGYRDPRGFPVWEKTTLSGIEQTTIGRDLASARLTAAIVTSFADRTEPSVESDVAYLERVAGGWRLAKPTAALYRAIGQPEIPPSVISPP